MADVRVTGMQYTLLPTCRYAVT